MTLDWLSLIENLANEIRGKNKSARFESIVDKLLKKYPVLMSGKDVPEQIIGALDTLAAGGLWKLQPKDRKKWKKGWRGLCMPKTIIYQAREKKPDAIAWHPILAKKGASTLPKGKFREKINRLNEHLLTCEQEEEEFFEGGVLGQRERALRIFRDEKALDNMPEEGWKQVALDREFLQCVIKPPPVKKKDCNLGQHAPIIIENVETYHSFVEINSSNHHWICVILGSGAQVIGQSNEIASIALNSNFDHVLYFGDLDAKGLEIVNSLRERLLNCGVNLYLAEPFYRYIIKSALSTDGKKANKAGQFNTDWIPSFIVKNLKYLISIDKRIPQEAFLKVMLEDVI